MSQDLNQFPKEELQKILLERESYDDDFIEEVLTELRQRADNQQYNLYKKSKGISKIGRNRQIINLFYIAFAISLLAFLLRLKAQLSSGELIIFLLTYLVLFIFGFKMVTSPAIRFLENGEGFAMSYYPYLTKRIAWTDLKTIKETPEQIQIILHSGKRVYLSNFSYDERKKKELVEVLLSNIGESNL